MCESQNLSEKASVTESVPPWLAGEGPSLRGMILVDVVASSLLKAGNTVLCVEFGRVVGIHLAGIALRKL